MEFFRTGEIVLLLPFNCTQLYIRALIEIRKEKCMYVNTYDHSSKHPIREDFCVMRSLQLLMRLSMIFLHYHSSLSGFEMKIFI